MKQILREEKGITLVALIITIIVLIILAAVTINAAFKSNFIEMATNGTANYANAQSYEQRMMDDLSDKLDGVINKISDIQSASSAERELDNFTKDPDAYKHPDQSEENKDRGVGTDGKPVNMDLWRYEIKDEAKKEIYLSLASSRKTGYIGEYINGEIQGTVPQYIKIDGKEGIYTVTDMYYTFDSCDKLMKAPKIPNSVIYMESTFANCTSLIEAPQIPSGVIDMDTTFYECSSLVKAPPELPNGVAILNSTFDGCSSLIEAPKIQYGPKEMTYTFSRCESLVKAPEIPDSVIEMWSTFSLCTSLVTAPKIPDSVLDMEDTFGTCSSLKEAPKIPANVTNMQGTFYKCSSLVRAPKIPNGVTNMNGTFCDCISLVEAPEIPANVTKMLETFKNCSSLKGKIRINSGKLENGTYGPGNWSFSNPITIQVPAGSTTYELINQKYGSNPNVTIETF